MIDTGDVDAFLGLDVGKGEHHGTALTPAGKRVFDKRLPNSEPSSSSGRAGGLGKLMEVPFS